MLQKHSKLPSAGLHVHMVEIGQVGRASVAIKIQQQYVVAEFVA